MQETKIINMAEIIPADALQELTKQWHLLDNERKSECDCHIAIAQSISARFGLGKELTDREDILMQRSTLAGFFCGLVAIENLGFDLMEKFEDGDDDAAAGWHFLMHTNMHLVSETTRALKAIIEKYACPDAAKEVFEEFPKDMELPL